MSETQQESPHLNSWGDEDIQNLRFGTHTSVPSRYPDRIRFFAISDFGNITPEVKDTAAAMNRYALEQGSPDFVVGLGDNFYPYGPDSADDKIFDTVWRDQFIKPYPSLQVPWRMVLGNHDYYGNALAEVDYHYHPKNKDNVWYMPSPYYSLSVNTDQSMSEQVSADFFFMDTNGVELDLLHSYPDLNMSLRDQKVLLDRCLSESTATWRIAFAHHPMYTAGNGHTQIIIIENIMDSVWKKYVYETNWMGFMLVTNTFSKLMFTKEYIIIAVVPLVLKFDPVMDFIVEKIQRKTTIG